MDSIGTFILTLLHAATNTHLLHWQTKSYAQHVALGEFYTELPELIDALVEASVGITGKDIDFPADYYPPAENGLTELLELREYFVENRDIMPPDSEIQNLLDNIGDQIDSTLFKLRKFP